jgi:hypothetical protein
MCSIQGCNNDSRTRGLCNKHYQKLLKYGNPEHSILKRAHPDEVTAFLEYAKSYESDECLIWPFGLTSQGYPRNRRGNVHRLMCPGEPTEEKFMSAHKCGNRSCINKRHLYWASYQDNSDDKYIHGTMPMGETHWRRRNS